MMAAEVTWLVAADGGRDLSEDTHRLIFEQISEDLCALNAREVQAYLERH